MKTNVLVTMAFLLAAMTLTTGCSKEENNKFMIDMEQISILVGDDHKVTPSGAFTARSTNEEVATVSPAGVIHGVSAGEADIIFTAADGGESQTCKVSVDWRYKYFDEPILDFSMTLDQVKARETHTFYCDNLWEPGIGEPGEFPDPWLARFVYSNEDGECETNYCWADKKKGSLYEIYMGWHGKPFSREKARQQLTERYGEPSIINDVKKEYRSERFKVRVIEGLSYVIFYPLL